MAGNDRSSKGKRVAEMKCRNHSHGWVFYKERLIFWFNDLEASINLEKNQKLDDDFCDTISAERKESKNHDLTEAQKQIIDSCGFSAPKAIVTFAFQDTSPRCPRTSDLANFKL